MNSSLSIIRVCVLLVFDVGATVSVSKIHDDEYRDSLRNFGHHTDTCVLLKDLTVYCPL
jgi:hypothetical protein